MYFVWFSTEKTPKKRRFHDAQRIFYVRKILTKCNKNKRLKRNEWATKSESTNAEISCLTLSPSCKTNNNNVRKRVKRNGNTTAATRKKTMQFHLKLNKRLRKLIVRRFSFFFCRCSAMLSLSLSFSCHEITSRMKISCSSASKELKKILFDYGTTFFSSFFLHFSADRMSNDFDKMKREMILGVMRQTFWIWIAAKALRNLRAREKNDKVFTNRLNIIRIGFY